MNERAANIILGIDGPGYGFTIKWCGIRFRLKVKLISTERLIRISEKICKIRDIEDEGMTYFQALMEHASDTKHICKAIAISTGTPFVRIVTRAISKLPLRDQQTLWKLVVEQSDPEVFFWIISSAKRLSLLKNKKAV